MNAETLNDVAVRAAEELFRAEEPISPTLLRKLAAEKVRAEIEAQLEAGRVLKLTDEEIRALRALRRFRQTCKPGAVFKWQTAPDDSIGVVLAGDSVHITDPQDLS